MAKNSFDVAYHEKKVVILGVTSIFPNLNGVLFQTEDQKGYQIEDYEMTGVSLNIEYFDPTTMEIPDDYEVLDHTAK